MNYLNEYWNYVDLLLIFLYFPTAIVDLLNKEPVYVTIAYCLLLIMIFIKFCFYLRIFEGFSFLVSMISAVLFDLRYFISFYTFVIGLFGMLFTLLVIRTNDEGDIEYYGGVSYFGYFLMAFRASMGDF